MLEVGEYYARIGQRDNAGALMVGHTEHTKDIQTARTDGVRLLFADKWANVIHIMVGVRDAYDGCVHAEIVEEYALPRR